MKKIIPTTFFLLFFAMITFAQTYVITGQVLTVEKDTLIGVLVYQKGTSNAVSTDIDGIFSLTVSDTGNVDLYFGFPGFSSLLLKGVSIVNNEINLSQIFLQEDECKIISRKRYTLLLKSEKKKYFKQLLDYSGSDGYVCCEPKKEHFEIKCASDSSVINKYEFDKEKQCMVMEFKNYKICP